MQNPNFITSQINFLFRTRMLWRDLATWLRSYKATIYGGLGNENAISQRLFQLPVEYGNILRVFFGDQATQQLINLLTLYISLLQSLFIAISNNDSNEIDNLTQQIYQNVISTAALLASINPYWTQGEWVTLLNSFTRMQIDEATTFLMEDYPRNIEIFDSTLSLTNIIGDYFSEGLTSVFLQMQQ
jgi:ribosomal protein S10